MGGREECLCFQFCGRFLDTARKRLGLEVVDIYKNKPKNERSWCES